ncbi:TIGR04053 family radical SAM/SPASM domain-containing protein [Tardisphaera miroshnichenkoae]
MDYSRNPVLVFWETTKACELACLHCRASAMINPPPGELSTKEARNLIEDLAHFDRPPVLVLSGGDPLMRKDLPELVDHARSFGIPLALSPAVSEDVVAKMAPFRGKVRSVSISLDGGKKAHDFIRGAGSFERTTSAIEQLTSAFELQVNTTVMRLTVNELPDALYQIKRLGIRTWEVFFLIRVGRATVLEDLNPNEMEDVLNYLYWASSYGIRVRTVEAPFFRRVIRERTSRPEYAPATSLYPDLVRRTEELLGMPKEKPLAELGTTRDGSGVIFVSNEGDVFPSGFTPYPLGNVRQQSLVSVYRENPVLKKIREASFSGKCGVCPYRQECGGSRARAFAAYGDPLGSDPACAYVPQPFVI